MRQTRRDFLLTGGCAIAGLSAQPMWPSPTFRAADDDEVRRRIAQVIEQYDAQGIHRTGADTDRRSGEWLAAQVRERGVAAALEAFDHNRIDPIDCRAEISGRRIEGLPLFDAAFTDAKGRRGKLGAAGSAAEIGMIELPPNAEYTPGYEQMRRESRHQALIVVTKGSRLGLSPINGSKFTEPYGPPMLQVGSEHGDWLIEQSRRNAEALVVARVNRTRTRAFNVTATIDGSKPLLAPVVVMTPRSGWWQCASERGGGIGCWMETIRAIAAAKPARDVHFLASSGHELGHLGLKTYIERRPELVRKARVWIHLGANIGAREAQNRIQAIDDEFERMAVEALEGAGLAVNDRSKRGSIPLGEAGNIHRGGGRYVSLLCPGSPVFHHPSDRWPEAVDVSAAARYASAFAGLAVKLAQE